MESLRVAPPSGHFQNDCHKFLFLSKVNSPTANLSWERNLFSLPRIRRILNPFPVLLSYREKKHAFHNGDDVLLDNCKSE